MNKLVSILFTFILVAGFYACSKDPSPAPDLGYNYFPQEVGSYIVYNVDSTYYDDFADSSRNYKFQIKEKIESQYYDNQNRLTMRLERYIKYYDVAVPYSSMTWQLRDVWQENRTATLAEKVEENVRFAKLAFPVKEGQTWNGNAQNTLGEEMYSYDFYDLPRTVGNIVFDSTLQVNQRDDQSLIAWTYGSEKYARNVGLIYTRIVDVQSQPNPNWSNPSMYPFGNDSLTAFYAKPILQRATAGYQLTSTITSYGTE